MEDQHGATRARARHIGAAAAALIAIGVLAPIGAGAAPTGAPPPAVIARATDGQTLHVSTCGTPMVQQQEATFTVERPNATSGTIEVDVTYGGTFSTDDTARLPDPIVIPAGETATEIAVPFVPDGSGTLTMTVEPGTGYVVGDPATATADFTSSTVGDPPCVDIDDVIPVGDTPSGYGVEARTGIDPAQLDMGTDVPLPPGLSLNQDGSWSGAATTPGTYPVTAIWIQGITPVLGIRWTIEVTANDDGSPTTTTTTTTPGTAAPADAVPGAADYAG